LIGGSAGLTQGAGKWIALAALVVMWGSAYAGLTIAVETIDPLWTAAGRLIGASACLGLIQLILLARSGRAAPEERTAQGRGRILASYAVIGGVFTAAPFCLYAVAARDTPSAILSICNGGSPFFTAVFAHLFLPGERLGPRAGIGVLCGFAGLAVLVGPQALDAGAGLSAAGVMLAILGAALYAGGNVATRLAPALQPVASSLLITATGGACALAAAVAISPSPGSPDTASLLALALLAVFPTGLATILYVWLIRHAGAMFVAYITYLAPLWAALIGVGLLGEPLTWGMALALALILAGVFVSNARFPRRDD